MNNLLIEQHQTEILEQFKVNFKNLILRKVQINIDELIKSTLNDLNIYQFTQADTSFLENWFNIIYNQSFIEQILLNNIKTNEFIFHAKDNCQLISLDENRFENIFKRPGKKVGPVRPARTFGDSNVHPGRMDLRENIARG